MGNLGNKSVYDGAASLKAPAVAQSVLLKSVDGMSTVQDADSVGWMNHPDSETADNTLTKAAIARATGPDLLAQRNAAPNDLTKPKSGHPTAPVGHAFVPRS